MSDRQCWTLCKAVQQGQYPPMRKQTEVVWQPYDLIRTEGQYKPKKKKKYIYIYIYIYQIS